MSLPPASPLLLPWRALRLAGRWLPWLVLWFSAGQLARFGLPWLAAEIGRGGHPDLRRVAVVMLFVLFVLATATTAVGMLYVLRRRDEDGPNEKFLDLLGRSLLPFVIVYVAWGLLYHDAAVFTFADLKRTLDSTSDPGLTAVIPDVEVAWGLAAGCFVVRALFERYHASRRTLGKPGRVSGLAAAFFEAAWTLFAVSSVSVTSGQVSGWLAGRRVWVGASSVLNDLLDAAPWLSTVGDLLGRAVSLVTNGLVLPLVWLTIAAIVYGVEVHDHREVLGGTRLERAADRLGGMRGMVRRPLGLMSADQRDKYLPLAYAVRLVWRGGIPLFASFALCYALAQVVSEQAWLGVTWLIGQQDPGLWHVLVVPVNFGRDLIYDVLRICVLAAAYGLIQERISAGSAAPSPAEMASSRG